MERRILLALTNEDAMNLGVHLGKRFKLSGNLADLQQAITLFEGLLRFIPVGDYLYCVGLVNLGLALSCRFQHFGDPGDLEQAISRLWDAVSITPHRHPLKPKSLNILADSLVTRFQHLGEPSDIEAAILRHKEAINLTPDGHPDKPDLVSSLGNSLGACFERFGKLEHLEDAISAHRDAVDLVPHGHPDKASYLDNLGNSLAARFQRLGKFSDLEEAISRHKDAVQLTSHDHPDKPHRLSNLGSSIRVRFECYGELSDLDESISRHRDATDLTSNGNPHKPRCLANLGNALYIRFRRIGELGDLEEAISRYRSAVDLTPYSHSYKPIYLNNLGNSFTTRFEYLQELGDLERAISSHRDAVRLTPDDHPDRALRLNNLGISLCIRFQWLGGLGDLEEAISSHKNAVDLTPLGHPNKPGSLNNLGNSLKVRFHRLGEPEDLEQAISRCRDSVMLTPDGHTDKAGHLYDLGNCLVARFERLGKMDDLQEAISRYKEVVRLAPDDHPDKPIYLNALGSSFRSRFERLGEPTDLEEAISRQMNAVHLAPDGHPQIPNFLSDLGGCFFIRFKRGGELSVLEEAISRCHDVLDIIPNDHPNEPYYLTNLGDVLSIRFKCLQELPDLEKAITLYSRVASTSITPITVRFRAAQKWISCARIIHHHTLFRAYSIAIDLLPQLAWIGLSLPHRYSELTRGVDVVREAAATALDLGLLEVAVEWLEQGRSIVWAELLRLRSSYEELSSVHPDHARRLRELSVGLEDAAVTREKSKRTGYSATESLHQTADRHRALAIERDKLLQEIRGLPGFERFLLRKMAFSQLRASAHSGPVVILNAAESRRDALIILSDVDHVIHVPLIDFTLQQSIGFQNMLNSLLGHARTHPPGSEDLEREGKSATLPYVSWEALLSTLWHKVVKHILDALAFSVCDPLSLELTVEPSQQTLGDLSRIFWCPTGPFVFLPIHAAGLYGTKYSQPGCKASDFVISSYVPSLSILVPSPVRLDTLPSSNLCLLAVRQPPSDGLSRLPGVEKELDHIRAVIRNSPSSRVTLLESSSGTLEEVLELMQEADWIHFACHGIQDASNPTDSGLCLADGARLKLSDVIAVSRPRGGLAFLSACQTAMGDEGLSDEAIHVAAGMLFAGYRGVIGTMWSISDRLAPRVARGVYEQLIRDEKLPDYRDAALALHEAVGRLRDSGTPFVEWLPFIHVGL